MTNEDKNELILADISEVMRRYARRSVTSGEAVKAIRNIVTPEPSSCDLMEFGKCSYKETGCSDCKIKSNLRYMCHSSSWQELQALREFKEKHEWIPIKTRPLTNEERVEFADHYGIEYCDTVDENAFDCPMPEDGQEILVSTKWGVCTDIADNDIDGEGFVVYGLEGNGDWEGIDAWMPLPKPYMRGDVWTQQSGL